MQASEICSIIKSCNENSVVNFEYGVLKISFQVEKHTTTLVEDMTEENHTKQLEEMIALEELETRERQLKELVIRDPVEFERLLASGDLVEEDVLNESDESED